MYIEISYEYEMKNSYQLNETSSGEWEITVAKNAYNVKKKFEELCLYEFLEMHQESRTPDPEKALLFTQRWGPLNSQPITRVGLSACELILRRMLQWSEELSADELKSLFVNGIFREHFDNNLRISVLGTGKNLRPVLRPVDLQTSILLAGLIHGRQDYVRCDLYNLIGGPRDENCPLGCWTRKKGRPGRDGHIWADDRCRAFFNRNKERRNWI